MQSLQSIDFQKQIAEALKKAKYRTVLYLYDDLGYKRLLGVFTKKTAYQIKQYLRKRKLQGRYTEFEIKTTEPENSFFEAIELISTYTNAQKRKHNVFAHLNIAS